MKTDKILLIPDYVSRSLEYNGLTLNDLGEVLLNNDVNGLKRITDTISHVDIRDIISLTRCSINRIATDSTETTIANYLYMLSNSINDDIMSTEQFINNIHVTADEAEVIVNENKKEIIDTLLTLNDIDFNFTIVNDIVFIVVSDNFVKLLKINERQAFVKLFANFINLQTKQYGQDVLKSENVYSFIKTLPNERS